MSSWDEVSLQFQHFLRHFDTLESAAIVALRDSSDTRLRRYAHLFDQSRSEALQVVLTVLQLESSVGSGTTE